MPAAHTPWLIRVLRRLLVSGRGEVRALEDAIHIAGVLRFVALLSATIVLPALLLAWLGLSSIRVEELDVMAEVEREASGVADAFWASTERSFSEFEQRVRDRLEAGRSPLESRGDLHPALLVALRFDERGALTAPFARSAGEADAPYEADLFDPAYAEAARAEREGADPARLATLNARAARRAPDRRLRGRALLDRARALAAAGRTRDAVAQYDEVERAYANVRDPWGFRLGDLAHLLRAEMEAPDRPDRAAEQLRALVDELLAAQWTVGQGGEAAVARRALSLIERLGGSREWVSMARGRLAERAAMLYWAGVLLPELESMGIGAERLRVDPGRFRWQQGHRAVWATTWWDRDLYAFAFDREALVSQLKADARASVLPDSPLAAWLVGPDERAGREVLVEKGLSPWLTGWSLVVAPRDPDALRASQARRRSRRVGIVALSLAMIGVGVFLSAVLVKRELDVARMKADFASNVSHELRSPITQIRLKGESLLLGLAETEEEREAHYQAIVREAERLSRLVDNVLDFGAIERGAKSYTLRPGDLAETVLRAMDSIRSAQEVQDKDLVVDLPDDLPVVHHDADAVAQCVINLVSNAAKYSSPGGRIEVTGRATADGVEISVRDEGIGIAPYDIEHVFEPFYRSRSASTRRRKGTGIGLTITRYIMEAHGGEVRVRSKLGSGSTFTLVFPRTPPPKAVVGRPLPAGSRPQGAS